LREAASFGQTIVDYAPGSSGAEDYGRLGVWVTENLVARKPLAADAYSGEIETAIDGTMENGATSLDVAVKPMAGQAVMQGAMQPVIQQATQQATQQVNQSVSQSTTAAVGTISTPTIPATNSVTNSMTGTLAGEPKPMTRAEDVARRAQEFLRRIASGRANGTAAIPSVAAENAKNNLENRITPPPAPALSVAQTATQLSSQLPNAAKQLVNLPTITMANGIAAPVAAASVANSPVEPKPIDASQGPALLEARNVLEIINEPAKVMTVHPSADRLLGVRETAQGLLFVQPMGTTKTIAIAGGFNNWSTTEHVMKRNEQLGVFELCIRLPKGTFAYRLVIDGQWTHDVHNPTNEPNPFGELNSLAVVQAGQLVTT
jgi:hypothetical protein